MKKIWEKIKSFCSSCYQKLFNLLLKLVKKEKVAKWIINGFGLLLLVGLLVLVYQFRDVILNCVNFVKELIK